MVRTAPRFGSHRGRAASLTLLGLALASFANAYFSYLPRLGDVVGPRPWPVASYQSVNGLGVAAARSVKPAKGTVVTVVVPGRRSGISPHTAMVYLPPQYFSQPTAHFPVLYLLHGSPGLPVDWFRGGEAATAGLAAATAGTPVILVAPKMSSGWLSDSECIDRRSGRWETYLTEDVVPAVDTRFPHPGSSYRPWDSRKLCRWLLRAGCRAAASHAVPEHRSALAAHRTDVQLRLIEPAVRAPCRPAGGARQPPAAVAAATQGRRPAGAHQAGRREC